MAKGKKSARKRNQELDEYAEKAAPHAAATGALQATPSTEDALLDSVQSKLAGRALLKIVGTYPYRITVGKYVNRGLHPEHTNALAQSIYAHKRDDKFPIRIAVDLDHLDTSTLSSPDDPDLLFVLAFKECVKDPEIFILDGNHRFHAAQQAYELKKTQIQKLSKDHEDAQKAERSEARGSLPASESSVSSHDLAQQLSRLQKALPASLYWQVDIYDSSEFFPPHPWLRCQPEPP